MASDNAAISTTSYKDSPVAVAARSTAPHVQKFPAALPTRSPLAPTSDVDHGYTTFVKPPPTMPSRYVPVDRNPTMRVATIKLKVFV